MYNYRKIYKEETTSSLMKKVFKVKPFINKKTKQISITIPKKKLEIVKGKFPKKIKLKIKEIEW